MESKFAISSENQNKQTCRTSNDSLPSEEGIDGGRLHELNTSVNALLMTVTASTQPYKSITANTF